MTAVNEIKAELIQQLVKGGVGENVVRALMNGDDVFVPFESELWDYKLRIEDAKDSLCELVRDVLAFFNTFGGYLIIGVNDAGELIGCDELNEQSIRQGIRNYSGIDISICVSRHEISGRKIQLILIPKRGNDSVPAAVSRIGAAAANGKAVFKPGDVYFRAEDSCQLIRGTEDLRFLMGERRHPSDVRTSSAAISLTPNNLPDRSVIYSKFFGREDVKEQLWAWLADPMSRYRVLAGPGGFGKTSAAYRFCEDVCAESPLGIEQVVWLSAKREQFIASKNRAEALPYRQGSRESGQSYHDYESLLDAISFHLPFSDEEWNGCDINYRLRMLEDGLDVMPSLIIVDDLDSLDPDHQRRAIQLAMSLGKSKSRFLFTTRNNYLAPSVSTTELEGLRDDGYREYVKYLQDHYSRKLNSSELKTLAVDTEGSPLFTESVFRLLRLGAKFGDAIGRWKGSDGEVVRAASFKRELEHLSWTSRRALYAISLFDSLSAAEIRQICELEIPEVEQAVLDLNGFFLLQSRQIGDQPRFGMAPNLKRLIHEMRSEFVPDHSEIARRAANLRKDAGASRGRKPEIASAIQQAMAQLGEGNSVGATSTLEESIANHPDSADLWMVYARCSARDENFDVEKVRRAFQKSYDLGKREPQLFAKWIEFEIQKGNSNAAMLVAEKGKEFVQGGDWLWKLKCAQAAYKRALEREKRRELADSMGDLRVAAKDVARAIKQAPASGRSVATTLGQDVHDAMWRVATKSNQFSAFDVFGVARSAVENGDRREVCISRMIEAAEFAVMDIAFFAKNRELVEDWLERISQITSSRGSARLSERLAKVVAIVDASIRRMNAGGDGVDKA